MTFDKRTRERLLAHCGQLHEDDGVDPRQFFKNDSQRNKANYKTQQLCRQVAQTLEQVLGADFADDRLRNLQVTGVEPSPNASQLSVTLRTDAPCGCEQLHAILDRLGAVTGRLRCEVAAAISRKRTPRLMFRVTCPQQEEGSA